MEEEEDARKPPRSECMVMMMQSLDLISQVFVCENTRGKARAWVTSQLSKRHCSLISV